MIFVNLNKSWRNVIAGKDDASRVTLEAWALVSEAAIETYGDVICGVTKGVVVTALDITAHHRWPDGRAAFEGQNSTEWAGLVGEPSPVVWPRDRPDRCATSTPRPSVPAMSTWTPPTWESDAPSSATSPSSSLSMERHN